MTVYCCRYEQCLLLLLVVVVAAVVVAFPLFTSLL